MWRFTVLRTKLNKSAYLKDKVGVHTPLNLIKIKKDINWFTSYTVLFSIHADFFLSLIEYFQSTKSSIFHLAWQ